VIGLLNAFGKLLALTPRPLLRLVCWIFGPLIGWVRPQRKRQAIASLMLAYPEWSARKIRRIYRENARRLIEMGLLVVALPHFSERQLRRMILLDETTKALIKKHFGADRQQTPTVLMIPHLTLSELLTAMPAVVDFPLCPTKVIFRPIPSLKLNRWVHESRSRHGVQLLSRKKGFGDAMRALANAETVGILFDQKAGGSGSLITFFDRICLASELPGILAEKYQAAVYASALERTDFWRAQLRLFPLQCAANAAEVTFAGHEWLQQYLSGNEERAADWLWLHDRWGSFYKPAKRFMLAHKRELFVEQNERLRRATLPRKEPVWCLLPESAKAAAAYLPVIQAIRDARPDFSLTLAAAEDYIFEWMQQGLAEKCLLLPKQPLASYRVFWSHRHHYPATVLVFDPSASAALGAWLLRCPQRFGMGSSWFKRVALTVNVDNPAAEEATQAWLNGLQAYGLRTEKTMHKRTKLPKNKK
jgi:lauroyl/myristoyl acyltransferase